jgi:hypothetical protein
MSIRVTIVSSGEYMSGTGHVSINAAIDQEEMLETLSALLNIVPYHGSSQVR